MRILQVMGGKLMSGAGRGALALHKGLTKAAVECRILGRLERELPDGIDGTRFSEWQRLSIGLRNRIYLNALRWRHGRPDVLFHPVSHGHDPHRHPLFGWADLVHVQWSQAAALGRNFWRQLPVSNRPVVFTLRDMWLFTGGCHFSGGCHGYEVGCETCTMLAGPSQTVTGRDVAFKRATVPHAAAFVAISRKIAEDARRSTILHDADIRVIPNSVDTGSFAAIDRLEARRVLNLPEKAFIIAFGALFLSERRKGAQVMQMVFAEIGDREDLHWAVFGGDPYPLPVNSTYFGLVEDNARLNLILSAADLFVMPSLQESFGKTTAEALASGTPVLAFDNTPAVEIIQHGQSGWIVPHGDATAVASGIMAVRGLDPMVRAQFGRTGRRHVLSSYAPAVVARQHIALYDEILARHRPPAQFLTAASAA